MARSMLDFRGIILLCLLSATVVLGKDPAQGWTSYATANCPNGTRMTKFEGKWKVSNSPPDSWAFFSPWIGSDTTDNMNLIQPVNPWLGSSWVFYTEYFQWNPMNNVNSNQRDTEAGHVLHGEMEWLGDNQYRITQTDLHSNHSSHQVVKVQKTNSGSGPGYKNFSVLYVVYEKVASCSDYPPEGELLFYDLYVECDGETFTPQWNTSYVDNVCDHRAHVLSPSKIKMTWNTNGESELTTEQLSEAKAMAAEKRLNAGKGLGRYRESDRA